MIIPPSSVATARPLVSLRALVSVVQAGGRGLTSELLLPVAGDLAALGLDGLLAVGARARPLAGAQAAVALVGHAHAPLPVAAGGGAGLLSCGSKAQG